MNPFTVKNVFFTHFRDFLDKERALPIFSIGYMQPNKISDDIRRELERPYTLSEAMVALQELNPNKSPGPDGVNAACLNHCWKQLEHSFLTLLEDFYHNISLPTGLNSSYIALIPKKINPNSPADYRPISLINTSMKLLLKILANRLNNALPHIIAEEHTCFMKGRITDAILITSEILHSMKTKKCKGVIFKLDFEKAFDTVNWNFLLDTLKAMNFGPKWIKWISSIFESIRIAILVNGSSTNEFPPSRGLRQGDLLSPFLFNIVGQILHLLLHNAKEQGKFKGINIGDNNSTFTHLQFADDTPLFINGDDHSIESVKRILPIFQFLSGLKFNFYKSELLALHYTQQQQQSLWATTLGCQIGNWPLHYLGVPLGIPQNNIAL